MKDVEEHAAYEALAGSQIVRDYEAAFHNLTAMSVKLIPGSIPTRRDRVVLPKNTFCTLVNLRPGGCKTCLRTEAEASGLVGKKTASRQLCCFAGLQALAVPVVIGNRHVATLLGGPVFLRKPRRRDFGRIARQLLEWGIDRDLQRAKVAYFRTRVVSEEQLRAMLQLLTIFGQHLAEFANSCLLAKRETEPPCVASAKDFVSANASERVSMRAAASHVHLSPHYFCKMFKKTTGMTFTEHLSRVRIEKAKGLLVDPFVRISEVAFASGFGSVPHFNTVFKRYAGKSPTEYRGSLGRQVSPWPTRHNNERKSQFCSSLFTLETVEVDAKTKPRKGL